MHEDSFRLLRKNLIGGLHVALYARLERTFDAAVGPVLRLNRTSSMMWPLRFLNCLIAYPGQLDRWSIRIKP